MLNKPLILTASERYWILNVRQIQVGPDDPLCSIVFIPLDSHVPVKSYRIADFNVTYRILVPMNLRCEISRSLVVEFFDIVQQENIQTAPGSYIGRIGLQVEDPTKEAYLAFQNSNTHSGGGEN